MTKDRQKMKKGNNFLLKLIIKYMENFQDRGVWIRIRIRIRFVLRGWIRIRIRIRFVLRGWIRIRIRIRFVLRGWIRIRIRSISDRIRNPGDKDENLRKWLFLHFIYLECLQSLVSIYLISTSSCASPLVNVESD